MPKDLDWKGRIKYYRVNHSSGAPKGNKSESLNPHLNKMCVTEEGSNFLDKERSYYNYESPTVVRRKNENEERLRIVLESMQAKERQKQGGTSGGTKLAQRYRPELGINVSNPPKWANETEGSEMCTPNEPNLPMRTSVLSQSLFLNPNKMGTYNSPPMTAHGTGRNSKDDSQVMTNILSIMQAEREEKSLNRRSRSHQLIKDGWIRLQQSLDHKIARVADGDGELHAKIEMEEWVKTIRHDRELISNLERAAKPSTGL
jgi:hypothetical protein